MEHHMHMQMFIHQREMYIMVSNGRHITELQIHWKDYLTDTWCYTRFPFEFKGTTSFTIYINKIIRFLSYTMLPHLETHHLLKLSYNNLLCMHWLLLNEYLYEVCYTILNLKL